VSDQVNVVNPGILKYQEKRLNHPAQPANRIGDNLMKHSIFIILLLTLGFSQSASDAVRLFEMETGYGLRAQSMGNAYTALSDDISGLYWNPAGLGQIKESIFSMGIEHGSAGNETTYLGLPTTAKHNWTKINGLGIVYPFEVAQGALAWGFSFNRIGDSEGITEFTGFSSVPNGLIFYDSDGNESAFDTDATRTESIRLEGGIDQWTTGLSVAVSPTTLVGASLALNTGDDTYHFQFNQSDTEHNYETYPADYDSYDIERYLQTEFNGIQLKLGALTSLGNIKIGGTFSPAYTYHVKEVFTEKETMTYDDGTYENVVESDPGQWTYAVKSPFQFSGGLAYSTTRFTLAASTQYKDWSQVEFDLSDVATLDDEYLDLLKENEIIRSTYKPALDFHFGGEFYLINNLVAVQGGLSLKQSRLENGADSKSVSGGVRLYPDSMVDIQLSYHVNNWEKSGTDEFTPSLASENITQATYQIGFNYRF